MEARCLVADSDICTLTETKLDSLVPEGSTSIEGYTQNRSDRNSAGGGVVTYINSMLRPVQLDLLQAEAKEMGLEMTLSRIEISKKKSLVILGIYRPPNAKKSWFSDLDSILLKLLCLGSLVMMGDLNADLLNPNVQPGKALSSSLELADTVVLNIQPTRIQGNSATCLDIIAIDRHLEVTDYSVLNTSASDHFPVAASLKLQLTSVIQPILRRNFNKVDMGLVSAQLLDISPPPDMNAELDEVLTTWHDKFIDIMDSVAPLRKTAWRKKPTPPWFNADIKFHIERRDWLGKCLKTCGEDEIEAIEEELKTARKIVKSRIRRAMKNEGSRALHGSNSREAWKFIRATTFSSRGKSDIPIEPDILNNALAAVVQSISSVPLTAPVPTIRDDSFEFHPFSENQVTRMLLSQKTNTATGPDEIPASLVHRLAPVLSPTITYFFNLSLAKETFPALWKRANVIPIYKAKGSKADPGNYRPISILPVLGRVLEKAVAAQLYEYCDKHEVIPKQQFGFRKNSNCEMALLTAMDFWLKAVDDGKYAGALLLDLSKAFDHVPHQLLLQELSDAGAGYGVLKWFSSYLTDRVQRVKLGEVTTNWLPVSRGVPQGSCLSPILFNIFVRNLPGAAEAECVQYADDLTESAADACLDIVAQKLASSFEKTKEFCDAHELTVNADKTQLVIFKAANRKIPEDFEILLDSNVIKPSKSAKLLGFTIDRHLTGAEHIDNISRKCHGLLSVLRRAAPCLPRELLRLAYISLIRSHLEFASAVLAPLSNTQLGKLDTIQRIAARIILGVPRDAHAAPLLDTLRLPPLELRRRQHIIDLVNKVLSGRCHPALSGAIREVEGEGVTSDCVARIGAGRKRFKMHACMSH